ncbi:MAG TPA: hypothetical protein VKP58_11080 [Candidatus Acidoferrum sp.]|nr:hypothetical protein [Candidatus Acidoferrum sp.]
MQLKTKVSKIVVEGGRHTDKRRGTRMNSRVPVRLEWDVQGGTRRGLDAHTRVVNPYGCMIVLPESFTLEHRLALTNLATGSSNAAVVVWKGNPRPEGWEYGIELVAPDMDFWGLEL